MSANNDIKKMIGEAFLDVANAIETGKFGSKIKVGVTTLGSEHGVENIVKGAELASKTADFDIVLIGPKVDTDLEIVEVNTEDEAQKKMEELLDSGYIKSCVTMHYSFPIGVSTVGRVVTPAKGKEMFVATTTGTSATNRSEAMFRNAIYGIIAAKAVGIKKPTVGILNVDNARAVERGLKELKANGYDITFGESARADGGLILRGNDALMGSTDIMVTDSLTGNILMKMFAAFTTGGDYEASGFGYGPGVGMDYERCILILSRASGVPVVAGAISYAAQLAKGDFAKVSKEEFEKAKAAGFDKIVAEFNKDSKKASASNEEVKMPEKEVVTGTVSGIDIMDLEDACQALWKNGIYAESGMGCTGPIVMVNDAKIAQAIEILAAEGYVSKEAVPC
jgi:glycine/sarcosine/betaine reductase complex component C subunit alpha